MNEGAPKRMVHRSWQEQLNPSEKARANEPSRPDDIIVEGESLLSREKSPLQEVSVRLAVSLIDKRLAQLGVVGRTLDTRRFVFLPFYDAVAAGSWSQKDDVIILPEYGEANVPTLIHEGLHMSSSQWYNRSKESFEAISAEREPKTGFATEWPAGRHPARSNFDMLNEAVTEKIANELEIENRNEIEEIKRRGHNRIAYHLDQLSEQRRASFERLKEEMNQEIKKYEGDRDRAIAELQKRVQERIREILEDPELSETAKEGLVKLEQDHFDHMCKFEEGFFETRKEMDEKFEPRSHELRFKGYEQAIQETFNAPLGDPGGYREQVKILDLLLDGLAVYESSKNGLPETKVRTDLWNGLQKAYFEGNVMWLRRIERVFGTEELLGKGVLSQIATLPHPMLESFMEEKPTLKIKAQLQRAVMMIRAGVEQ